MKCIYDVLLNFSDDKLYDFYEWHPDDEIEYFKRVPLIRICKDEYAKIDIGSRIEDDDFLNSIYNVTEIYQQKTVKRVDYACILTDGKQVIATLFNKTGEVLMTSKMLLDEEEEALEISAVQPEIKLEFIVSRTKKCNGNYLTRFEDRKRMFLNKEIDDLYNNKNLIKLKYLYYECSKIVDDNIDNIYQEIKLFLDSDWGCKHNELYDLVRLSYSKR